MRDKLQAFNTEVGLKTIPLCVLFCFFPFDIVVDAIDALL